MKKDQVLVGVAFGLLILAGTALPIQAESNMEFANHCLRISKAPGGVTTVTNSCSRIVHMAYCGVDGDGSGGCIGDIGQLTVTPGETAHMSQGQPAARFHFISCFDPFRPHKAKHTGNGLRASCRS